MIRAPKRTWMKVTDPGGNVVWAAVEYDAIVQLRWLDLPDEDAVDRVSVTMRADDTLSKWARDGDKVEGPFNAPE